MLVGDHDLMAVHRIIGIGIGLTLTGLAISQKIDRECADYELRDKAPAVISCIDDEPGLFQLRIESPLELDKPGGAHVGDMDISHSATGLLGHILTLAADPFKISKIAFVSYGLDDYVPRSLPGGLVIHGKEHLFAGHVEECGIEVGRCAKLPAVYRNHIIAILDPCVREGKRGDGIGARGLRRIDLLQPVVTTCLVRHNVSTQHPDRNTIRTLDITTPNIGV